MDGHRSKSYACGRMEIEVYGGGRATGARPDFRSYSYSSGGASSYQYQYEYGGYGLGYDSSRGAEEVQKSKSKTRWSLVGDPDMERKKRVATYKAYAMEGKMKGSFRKSFRWLKDRYMQLVYGWS